MKTVLLRVKGAKYYHAEELIGSGDIFEGAPVILKPEPDNKYDKNAVAIYSNTDEMIGHISKDIAAKSD